MISEILAAGIIAATAFSPSAALSIPPDPAPSAQSSSTRTTIPLVRENATSWWTIRVNQTCPPDFPYVHEAGWGWTNTPHDNIVFWDVSYGNTVGEPATRIAGFMTNWNLETRWVEANLACTSDAGHALIVPPRPPL
ncbi:hypothetical protein [Agromyces aerolatus]|uniref:hypothetical protein n=1 Tax=Agromyces sp. LY-1074 TaxID=3074080 RepID=UPI0028552E18|nr:MULTISPECIES: hypothetical protein [unclassified Agromyces]MDR5701158.1 hypothetical protein [Agromyces sp. LY-1074]MDR5707798.1 hypothetical protein [Agromyces sp. LY-1358]